MICLTGLAGRRRSIRGLETLIQKTFKFTDTESLEKMLADIRSDPDYQTAGDHVLIFFSPEVDEERITSQLKRIKECLPDLKVFGMGLLGPLTKDMVLPLDTTICSLLLFQTSHVKICTYDCHQMTPRMAAGMFLRDTKDIHDLRGIFFSSSDASLLPEDFIDGVSEACPDIPIFGGQAGARDIASQDTWVFRGTKILRRHILAVAFYGPDLHVDSLLNFGWHPLGKWHVITETAGDGRIISIDNQPALDLYKWYLGFAANRSFYENNSAFPLLEKTGNIYSARIPYRFLEDGSLYMTVRMPEGAKVSLSYTRESFLFQNSLKVANEMAAFQPQAIIMICCLNRRLFMGNQGSSREIDYFRKFMPQLLCGYGMSEVYRVGPDGGVMNSTMIVTGLREGEPASGALVQKIRDLELEQKKESGYYSMSERLVTFLERTTQELHDTIRRLSEIAGSDQLTGVANRRMLDQEVGKLLEECRKGHSCCALMYDIDYFKQVNDTYGHKIGDQVLCEMTDFVRKQLRETDVIGRWGGEEFMVLLRDISINDVVPIAERIRRRVDEHSFALVGHVTISIGVVAVHQDDDLDSLFSRLDHLLYVSKRRGRNCIACESIG